MPSTPRQTQRQRLLKLREDFASSPQLAAAQHALADHLTAVLAELEPDVLGAYWPVRSEFNAASLWAADAETPSFALALPFTRRMPREMHYRTWDRQVPALKDEVGIPATDGHVVVPDVVLVPCVGYTASGFRLGYGGGYFDRWIAAHPHVTAVGIAWSNGRLDDAEFAAEAHDLPLAFVVTEHGVVS